jgi:3'-phosphoadenosine 5'-phosphosulfate sulfotransferase (PAPS reductase)/FAD synthetase
MSQQLILEQQKELTVSQILRVHGKQFRQITERYSDGQNGRCALGVIMSYFGWSGRDDSQASAKLLGTLIALRSAGIDKNLLIEMNDSGYAFDEIADYIDRILVH